VVEGGSSLHRPRHAAHVSVAPMPGPLSGSAAAVWQLLAPGALCHDVPASAAARRRLARRLRTLPPGTTIVLRSEGVGSRQRCRHLARDAGIELIREYVAVPSIDPPTCYVEDSTSALRYFTTHVLALPGGGPAASAALEAAKSISGSILPLGLVGRLAPNRLALGRIPAPRRVSGADDASLLELPGTQTLVLAFSKDPNAKLTVLLFPPGSRRPALAIKVPTTAVAEASIEAERSVLSGLHAGPSSAILTSIPKIDDRKEVGVRPSLVTTALRGSPMTTRYHAWRHLATAGTVRADFLAVERWLAGFQSATAGPRSPLELERGTADALSRRFAGDPRLDELLSRLRDIHATLRTSSTPRTAVHGDFWFGNLLWEGGEISGVVDWENGAVTGEPVRDLVRFPLTYALYLDRHTRAGRQVAGHRGLRAGVWGSGITFAVNGDGWFPDLVRDFVRGGLKRLGADAGSWRLAMLAGLAEVAATADHLDFAERHWRLFERLTEPTATP
jgi:phosphotransferase family enzyme